MQPTAESLKPKSMDSIGKDYGLTVQQGDDEKEVVHKHKPHSKCVSVSFRIVEHKWFMALTAVLTVYALTADDCRILSTNLPADTYFNGMIIFCLLVFSTELVLSCFGKPDYFLGFFFWLDLFSTCSMVLDLTWVSDLMSQGGSVAGSNSSGKNVRSGRTARVGARAGRVVRVLRLVRILKLYKAYVEARRKQANEEKKRKAMEAGTEDDWADEEVQEEFGAQDKESRVGKKLSEETTRKVICLILLMLVVLPLLEVPQSDLLPVCPGLAASYVQKMYMEYKQGQRSKIDYEKGMLGFIYYHNWYANWDQATYCPGQGCASILQFGQMIYIGVTGSNASVVAGYAQDTALSQSVVADFVSKQVVADSSRLMEYGSMPKSVTQDILPGPWNTICTLNGNVIQGISLIGQPMHPLLDYPVVCPDALRRQETVSFMSQSLNTTEQSGLTFIFYFDVRPYARADSANNLYTTLFIMVLLIGGSLIFAHDANRLVLHPLEKMIDRIEAIGQNPLIAMKMADDEFKVEEIKRAKRKKERKWQLMMDLVMCKLCNQSEELMETVILEKTIIKLGSLLALGFGEAGAEIIGQNMKGGDSAGVNAMIPGRRVECIIGSVRVKDFSVATEVLQSKIMTFGNQIAEIVHGVCQEMMGAPNKNNGDMFLIIWKVEEGHQTRVAESSIVAFSTILGSLHESPLLATYRGHPGLQNRLGRNCRVNLGQGLHRGWAIEGAVGSEYKIDASYLSPNVSIAISVERATELYNVPIMVAESVVEICGLGIKSKCRLIDKVIITGCPEPMEIYCVDLDYHAVQVAEKEPCKVPWNTRQRFKVRQIMETDKAVQLSKDFSWLKVFEANSTIAIMRRRYNVEFFQLFNMGYQNYSQGEWQVAKRMLSCTRSLLGAEDGPSSALLRFMEGFEFEAPKDWTGVRDLVDSSSSNEAKNIRSSVRRMSRLGGADPPPSMQVPIEDIVLPMADEHLG